MSATMTAPRSDAALDTRHMQRAIELAWRGWGRVQPNPLVGAVVTDAAGGVIAEGWHAEYGEAHAEAMALEHAGARAAGGTLYVTLEPCAHHGKTPPCTDAVLRSGVARVVIAQPDPNPIAAGGAERLRAAGIEVDVGLDQRAAADQNAAFLHWHRTGTPYVALKFGMSLDARIAAARGVTTAVTGADAQAEVHRLRAGFDAIMIGAETARVDDPQLTARGAVAPRRAPLRVVLASEGRLAPDARLASDTAAAPTMLLAASDASGDTRPLEARGVRVARARRAAGGGLDLDDVMAQLAAADVRSVLCEGGGRLGSALIAADLVQRLYLFVAPTLLGANAPAAFVDVAGPAVGRGWRLVRSARFGDDTLLELARD